MATGPLRFRIPATPKKPKAPATRLTKAEREKAAARKEKNHDTYVRRTYGLAPGDYQTLLANQGGRCAICGKHPRKRYLAVDHCHGCGAVRGLLCYFCNSALGVFEGDAATAQRAAEYLLRARDDLLRHPPVEADTPPPVRVKGDDLPF